MASWRFSKKRMSLLVAAACLCGLVAAGCDDRVQVTRDPDVRIARNATWAWQPAEAQAATSRDSRRVLSRDVINRNDANRNEPVLDTTANNDVVRDRVKQAIQQNLTAKGLTQVSDPAAADFLVDYHFAVERRSATVQTVYPGAYPGLVCGPYGCYRGWGYGPGAVGYERVHFHEGTIVFDFTQRTSSHLVYRAVGQNPVRRDTFSLTQNDINDLVNHLLKDLKTRK
jgi:Domain of unknown function (DUF4136)